MYDERITVSIFGHDWKYNGNTWKALRKNPDAESPWSYEEVIKLIHPQITWLYEFDNDYQGDFFFAGYDEWYKWYYLEGSFGSCSGCDWLESLGDVDDIREFLTYHKKSVIKKHSKNAMLEYLKQTFKNVHERSTLGLLMEKIKGV